MLVGFQLTIYVVSSQTVADIKRFFALEETDIYMTASFCGVVCVLRSGYCPVFGAKCGSQQYYADA